MAVSKKGQRKVTVKGKHYFWSVKESEVQVPDEGFVGYGRERHVHIISADKQFIVRYRCPAPGDPFTTLQVEGSLFPREPKAKEVQVPRWRHDSKRYPTADFVRRLINWCLESESKTAES